MLEEVGEKGRERKTRKGRQMIKRLNGRSEYRKGEPKGETERGKGDWKAEKRGEDSAARPEGRRRRKRKL